MATAKSPEDLKAERLAREQRAVKDAAEALSQERNQASTLLLVVGVVLIAVGIWFLLYAPGAADSQGEAIVNLHRLTLGETAAIAGAIFFSAGVLVRYK